MQSFIKKILWADDYAATKLRNEVGEVSAAEGYM